MQLLSDRGQQSSITLYPPKNASLVDVLYGTPLWAIKLKAVEEVSYMYVLRNITLLQQQVTLFDQYSRSSHLREIHSTLI